MEPSTKAEDLVARGCGSSGMVSVQGPGLPDANEPGLEKSDDRGEEADGGEVGGSAPVQFQVWAYPTLVAIFAGGSVKRVLRVYEVMDVPYFSHSAARFLLGNRSR